MTSWDYYGTVRPAETGWMVLWIMALLGLPKPGWMVLCLFAGKDLWRQCVSPHM
jgi:hypothetical protein